MVPASPERTEAIRTESITEAAAPEGTMVAETQVDAIHAFETAFISTPIQSPPTATTLTSQDISATTSTAKTLLLLTIGSKFDKTETEAALILQILQLYTLRNYLLKNHLVPMSSLILLKFKWTLF